jgi:hypothetical protein
MFLTPIGAQTKESTLKADVPLIPFLSPANHLTLLKP